MCHTEGLLFSPIHKEVLQSERIKFSTANCLQVQEFLERNEKTGYRPMKNTRQIQVLCSSPHLFEAGPSDKRISSLYQEADALKFSTLQ